MFVCFTPSGIKQLLLLRSNISRGNIGNQHDITSFVIMRNIFPFRLNGRKSIYFCGESSYVSVLLAILCLSVLPQALLYSFNGIIVLVNSQIGFFLPIFISTILQSGQKSIQLPVRRAP